MTYRTLASELDMNAHSRLTLANGETRAGFYRGCIRENRQVWAILEACMAERYVPIASVVRAECVRELDPC